MTLALSRRAGVIDAGVAVGHAVAQHVVARPEHGGGDSKDRCLRTAPGFEAEELRVEGGALRAHAGPGNGDKGGLEPGRTVARRDVADVRRAGEQQGEVRFEPVPDGLPSHARGLHADVRAAVRGQPVGQGKQARGWSLRIGAPLRGAGPTRSAPPP